MKNTKIKVSSIGKGYVTLETKVVDMVQLIYRNGVNQTTLSRDEARELAKTLLKFANE